MLTKRKWIQIWWDRALSLFFPKRCVFCRELLPLSHDGTVCVACSKNVSFCLEGSRCKTCGKPMEQSQRYCKACDPRRGHDHLRMTAAYRYEGLAKQSLLRFKKERYQSYATTYAEYMHGMVLYDFPDVEFDMIVSVPPRLERIRKIGYDQAEDLGRAVGKRLDIPYKGRVLAQKEQREKQSSLSAEERLANVRGNFRVKRGDVIQEKTILLVDDICTTGATLRECAKTLYRSGAGRIYCVTAATTALWQE